MEMRILQTPAVWGRPRRSGLAPVPWWSGGIMPNRASVRCAAGVTRGAESWDITLVKYVDDIVWLREVARAVAGVAVPAVEVSRP